MPRLSNHELKNKSVVELEAYAEDHPKEGFRVAGILGEASARIVYKTIRRKIPDCHTATATYSYSTN